VRSVSWPVEAGALDERSGSAGPAMRYRPRRIRRRHGRGLMSARVRHLLQPAPAAGRGEPAGDPVCSATRRASSIRSRVRPSCRVYSQDSSVVDLAGVSSCSDVELAGTPPGGVCGRRSGLGRRSRRPTPPALPAAERPGQAGDPGGAVGAECLGLLELRWRLGEPEIGVLHPAGQACRTTSRDRVECWPEYSGRAGNRTRLGRAAGRHVASPLPSSRAGGLLGLVRRGR